MHDDSSLSAWPLSLRSELVQARQNGHVGNTLVSETDQYRIWLIALSPRERLPFHTHVLNYFWVATSAGLARSHYGDGSIVEARYGLGQTQHLTFGTSQFMTHDLENIGDTVLTFTTVEDKRSPNAPLSL